MRGLLVVSLILIHARLHESSNQAIESDPGFAGFFELSRQISNNNQDVVFNFGKSIFAPQGTWNETVKFILSNNPYQDPTDYAPSDGFDKARTNYDSRITCLERYHVCHGPVYGHRYARRYFHELDFSARPTYVTGLQFGPTGLSSRDQSRGPSLSQPDATIGTGDGGSVLYKTNIPPPKSRASVAILNFRRSYGAKSHISSLNLKGSALAPTTPTQTSLVESHSFTFNDRLYLVVSKSNRVDNPLGLYGLTEARSIAYAPSRSDSDLGSNPEDLIPTNSEFPSKMPSPEPKMASHGDSPVKEAFDRVLTHVYRVKEGIVADSSKAPSSHHHYDDESGDEGGEDSSLALLAHVHKYPSYKSAVVVPAAGSDQHVGSAGIPPVTATTSHFVFYSWRHFSATTGVGVGRGQDGLYLTFLTTTRTLLLNSGGGSKAQITVVGIELNTYVEVYNVLQDGYVDLFKRKYLSTCNGIKVDFFEIFTLPALEVGDGRKMATGTADRPSTPTAYNGTTGNGGEKGRSVINVGGGKSVYAVLAGRPGLRGLTKFRPSSASGGSYKLSYVTVLKWNHVTDDFAPIVTNYVLPTRPRQDLVGTEMLALRIFGQKTRVFAFVIQRLDTKTSGVTLNVEDGSPSYLASILELENKGTTSRLILFQHLCVEKPTDVYEIATDIESEDGSSFIIIKDQSGKNYLYRWMDHKFALAKVWPAQSKGIEQYLALVPNPAASEYRGEELLISLQHRTGQIGSIQTGTIHTGPIVRLLFERIRKSSGPTFSLGLGGPPNVAGTFDLTELLSMKAVGGVKDFSAIRINAQLIKDKIYLVVETKGSYISSQLGNVIKGKTGDPINCTCSKDAFSNIDGCSTKSLNIFALKIQIKPSIDPISAENLKIMALLEKMDAGLDTLEKAIGGLEYALKDIYKKVDKSRPSNPYGSSAGVKSADVVRLANKNFLGHVAVKGSIKTAGPPDDTIRVRGSLQLVEKITKPDKTESYRRVFGIPRFDSALINSARVCLTRSGESLHFARSNLPYVVRSSDSSVNFDSGAILKLNSSAEIRIEGNDAILDLSEGAAVDIKTVNGIDLQELDSSIKAPLKHNDTHVIDSEIIFQNELNILGDLHSQNINGVHLSKDAITTNTVQEISIPIIVSSDVNVSPNLQVDNGINGIELSQFLDLNQAFKENRTISFERLDVTGEIIVQSGIISGAKFVEFLDTLFLLDQDQYLKGIKQLTQSTIFRKPINVLGMLNGKNITGIIEHSIRIDADEAQTINWPRVTLNGAVNIQGNLRVEKLLNKFNFSDYLVTQGIQKFTIPITFERDATFHGPMELRDQGKLLGFSRQNSENWILNDGSTITIEAGKTFERPVIFTSGLSLVSTGNLIDGTSAEQLRSVITGPPNDKEWEADLEFERGITFKGMVRVTDNLNGVYLDRHFESILNKSYLTQDGVEIALTGAKTFQGHITLDRPLTVGNGHLNGYDLTKDYWLKRSTEPYTAISDVRVSGAVNFVDDLSVAGRLNEVEWQRFLTQRITLSRDQMVTGPTLIFNNDVTIFRSNVTVSGLINDQIDPTSTLLYGSNPESLTIYGNKTIEGEEELRVEHKLLVVGDCYVDGSYNRDLNLSLCLDDRLTLSTDQIYSLGHHNQIVIGEMTVLKNLNSRSLNSLSFETLSDHVLTLDSDQTFSYGAGVSFNSPVQVSTKGRVTAHKVNGLAMAAIFADSINLTAGQSGSTVMLNGHQTFSDQLIFGQDLKLPSPQASTINDITFGALDGGIYARANTPQGKQLIDADKIFANGFSVTRGQIIIAKINGEIDFPTGYLHTGRGGADKDFQGGQYEDKRVLDDLIFTKAVIVKGNVRASKMDSNAEVREASINGHRFGDVFQSTGLDVGPFDRANLLIFKSDVSVRRNLIFPNRSSLNNLDVSNFISGAILSPTLDGTSQHIPIAVRGQKAFAPQQRREGSEGIRVENDLEIDEKVLLNERDFSQFVNHMVPCDGAESIRNLYISGPVRVRGNLILNTERTEIHVAKMAEQGELFESGLKVNRFGGKELNHLLPALLYTDRPAVITVEVNFETNVLIHSKLVLKGTFNDEKFNSNTVLTTLARESDGNYARSTDILRFPHRVRFDKLTLGTGLHGSEVAINDIYLVQASKNAWYYSEHANFSTGRIKSLTMSNALQFDEDLKVDGLVNDITNIESVVFYLTSPDVQNIRGKKCFKSALKFLSNDALNLTPGNKVLGVDLEDILNRAIAITKYALPTDIASNPDHILGIKLAALTFNNTTRFYKNLENTGHVNSFSITEFVEALEEYKNFAKLNVAKNVGLQDDQCRRMTLLESICEDAIFYLSHFKVAHKLDTLGATNFQILPHFPAANDNELEVYNAIKTTPLARTSQNGGDFTVNDYCAVNSRNGENFVYEIAMYDVSHSDHNALLELRSIVNLTSASSHLSWFAFSLRTVKIINESLALLKIKPYLAQLGCGPLVVYTLKSEEARFKLKQRDTEIMNVKGLSFIHVTNVDGALKISMETGSPITRLDISGLEEKEILGESNLDRGTFTVALQEDDGGHSIKIYRLNIDSFEQKLVHTLKPQLSSSSRQSSYEGGYSLTSDTPAARDQKITAPKIKMAPTNKNDVSNFKLFTLTSSAKRLPVSQAMLLTWSTTRTSTLSPKAFVYGFALKALSERTEEKIEISAPRIRQFILSYGIRDVDVILPPKTPTQHRKDIYRSGFSEHKPVRTRLVVASERGIKPTETQPEIDIEIYDFVESGNHGNDADDNEEGEVNGMFEKVQTFPEANVVALAHFSLGNFPDTYIVVARTDNMLNIYHYKGIMGFDHWLSLRAAGVKAVTPFFLDGELYLSVFKDPQKSRFIKTLILRGVTVGHSFKPRQLVCNLSDRI